MFSTQMGNNNLHSWLKEIFGTNQLDPQISVYFVSSKTRRGSWSGSLPSETVGFFRKKIFSVGPGQNYTAILHIKSSGRSTKMSIKNLKSENVYLIDCFYVKKCPFYQLKHDLSQFDEQLSSKYSFRERILGKIAKNRLIQKLVPLLFRCRYCCQHTFADLITDNFW